MEQRKIRIANIYDGIDELLPGRMHPFLSVGDFRVRIERCMGLSEYRYTNKRDELVLVVEGEIHLETDQGVLSLKKGDIVLLPQGLVHGPIQGNNALLLILDQP